MSRPCYQAVVVPSPPAAGCSVREYAHGLLSNGLCRWFNCGAGCPTRETFLSHLLSAHGSKKAALVHVRAQIEVVTKLRCLVREEDLRLEAMSSHVDTLPDSSVGNASFETRPTHLSSKRNSNDSGAIPDACAQTGPVNPTPAPTPFPGAVIRIKTEPVDDSYERQLDSPSNFNLAPQSVPPNSRSPSSDNEHRNLLQASSSAVQTVDVKPELPPCVTIETCHLETTSSSPPLVQTENVKMEEVFVTFSSTAVEQHNRCGNSKSPIIQPPRQSDQQLSDSVHFSQISSVCSVSHTTGFVPEVAAIPVINPSPFVTATRKPSEIADVALPVSSPIVTRQPVAEMLHVPLSAFPVGGSDDATCLSSTVGLCKTERDVQEGFITQGVQLAPSVDVASSKKDIGEDISLQSRSAVGLNSESLDEAKATERSREMAAHMEAIRGRYRNAVEKPPFPLRCLIKHAIDTSPTKQLTTDEICEWLTGNFLHYRTYALTTRVDVQDVLKLEDAFQNTENVGGLWRVCARKFFVFEREDTNEMMAHANDGNPCGMTGVTLMDVDEEDVVVPNSETIKLETCLDHGGRPMESHSSTQEILDADILPSTSTTPNECLKLEDPQFTNDVRPSATSQLFSDPVDVNGSSTAKVSPNPPSQDSETDHPNSPVDDLKLNVAPSYTLSVSQIAAESDCPDAASQSNTSDTRTQTDVAVREPLRSAYDEVESHLADNRDFYRSSNQLPPYPARVLIRQSITESTDRRLSILDIGQWLKENFLYYQLMAHFEWSLLMKELLDHKCFVEVSVDSDTLWTVDDNIYYSVELEKPPPAGSSSPSDEPSGNRQQMERNLNELMDPRVMSRQNKGKRPDIPLCTLVKRAIDSSPGKRLTLLRICAWLSGKFPYFLLRSATLNRHEVDSVLHQDPAFSKSLPDGAWMVNAERFFETDRSEKRRRKKPPSVGVPGDEELSYHTVNGDSDRVGRFCSSALESDEDCRDESTAKLNQNVTDRNEKRSRKRPPSVDVPENEDLSCRTINGDADCIGNRCSSALESDEDCDVESTMELPLWISAPGQEPPPLCGSVPAEPGHVASAGARVAAQILNGTDTCWTLAKVVSYHAGPDEYVLDVRRRCHVVNRAQVVPLPLLRSNPATDPGAIFAEGAPVLALYPRTSQFWRAIVWESPTSADDAYRVAFEEAGTADGYSRPVGVAQGYVISVSDCPTEQ